jgi:hypothetical protein
MRDSLPVMLEVNFGVCSTLWIWSTSWAWLDANSLPARLETRDRRLRGYRHPCP